MHATRTANLRASKVTGDRVDNYQGEKLGSVEDLVIDLEKGCIAYAVLSFGGFLGMGDKLFAIPWEKLELDEDNRRLLLNLDKETLRNAPGFDKDHWPGIEDRRYTQTVYDYYGTARYW